MGGLFSLSHLHEASSFTRRYNKPSEESGLKLLLEVSSWVSLCFIFLVFFNGINAFANHSVGLIPSTDSLGRAEAITSAPNRTDALFYNPASLPWQSVHIGIAGIEFSSDKDSIDKTEASSQSQQTSDESVLKDFYQKLNSEHPIEISSTARLIQIVLPFVSVSSFAKAEANSQKVRGTDAYHAMKTKFTMGLIAGLGFSIKRLSFGYSTYGLIKSSIESSPTEDQLSTISNAIENNNFDENTVPFRDFTRFYYGGARGSNAGVQWQLFDDNPSSIGIAVLNIGDTKFKKETPFEREDVKEIEETLTEESQVHNITLELPQEIPQMLNAGIALGYGKRDSIGKFRVALDYNDINGDVIEKIGRAHV